MKTITVCLTALATLAAGTATTLAQRNNKSTPPVELTDAGAKLEAQYAARLESLQAGLAKSLPKVGEGKKSNYLEARAAEIAAIERFNAAEAALANNNKPNGLLNHRKGWIERATKGVAEAEAALKEAHAMTGDAAAKAEAVKAAEKALADIRENHANATSELKKAEAGVAIAKREEPPLIAELEAATKALAAARTATFQAVADLDLTATLSSPAHDAMLAPFVVLREATPRGLAAFAQQGKAQQDLVERMLGETDLLVQMLVADGAREGKWGRAFEIYDTIVKASPQATQGTLQRLALATALEHAAPHKQRNIASKTDAPEFIDPVDRYLHFEKAFLAGELDAGFKDHSVWDMRMIVDGEEPNEILTWGRQMLHNYRPDHITAGDRRWRYVAIVRSDVKYGSQDNKYDMDELHFFQNILMNGGICGRRAFIGRFILRAFGVPTTARPQRGHAALVRWTPDGWVAVLGAGWGSGWTKTPYDRDLDFLATTQARSAGDAFLQVKRAQWIGDVMGEPRTYGFIGQTPGFWNGVSLYTQRSIIEAAEKRALAAVGEDIGEANETKEKVEIAEVTLTEEDRKITADAAGVITIPAAATSNPTQSTSKILFLESNLGGKQLHYNRTGDHQPFEYTFDAPAAGKYHLTARVVTPSWKQTLDLTVNGAAAPTEVALPFTVGMWGQTEPAEIELKQGANTLRFTREGDVKGITIRDFTLTPVSGKVSQR